LSSREEEKQEQEARHRDFYDAVATSVADVTLMNYGYAPDGPAIESPPGSEYLCLELYRHVARPAIRGGRVLEVSCGRGGGAHFVARTFEPARLIGVDLSAENVRLAEARFGDLPGLEFRVGNAEALDFPDQTFDAVFNVEASHLYPDPARFLAEVYRVLRPGGGLLYADLFWRDSDPEEMLQEAGLVIHESHDVTPNVLRALELDSERRDNLAEPGLSEDGRREFRDWAGVKGYRAYNRFASGEWIYRSFEARRPEAAG
jgi:ubiquinone/menaquinone biosynthesis C-methylase UbiE